MSGAVDFGHLQDHDKPMLTTMTLRKSLELAAARGETMTSRLMTSSSATSYASTSDESKTKQTEKKKKNASSSDDSDDDDDDDDSDSSSEDDDTDDSDSNKKKKTKAFVAGRRCCKTVDRGTMTTDLISVQDKGVNTKARSLRSAAAAAAAGHPQQQSSSSNIASVTD